MTETLRPESIRPGGRPVDDQSLGELVATMSRDLSVLVHREVELAKAEITADIKRAGVGAGLLGGAGFLGYFGALFISVAAAFGIHGLGLALGWSFLIVAGAYFALAGVFALGGLKSVRKVGPPRRTIATVKDDLAWVRHPRQLNGNRAG
ncbi:MAG: phage holin family protein [Actinomycetes bacterium]